MSMKVTINCPQVDEKLMQLEKLVQEINDIAKALNPVNPPSIEIAYKVPNE